MVNVISREVPRPKPKGPQAPRVWLRDLLRHNIHHGISIVFSLIKCHSYSIKTSKKGFLSGWAWPMDSLGIPLDIIPGFDSEYWWS